MSGSNQPIRNIVFDLGGVLIDWNPRFIYSRMTSDSAKVENFLANVATGDWNSRLDAGTDFKFLVAEKKREAPEWADWIEAWRSHWPTMLGEPILPMVAILEDLSQKRTRPLYALSNWSAETFPVAQAKFPFLNRFDRVFISGQEKLIKPDPRFFELLLKQTGIQAEVTLFIDDVEKNVAAAKALGFQTHLFTNNVQSIEQLKKLLS